MREAFRQSGKSIKNLFAAVDKDNSGEIDKNEFKLMFQMMKVEMSPTELDHIFNSIDIDLSQKITCAEF